MATKNAVETPYNHPGDTDGYVLAWTLANLDDGNPKFLMRFNDRTVQVTGTFGAGGTVVLEGTIDGVNYQTLRDPAGNLLSFTAAGLKGVLEAVVSVRPRVTAGDGTTNLVVSLLLTRTK